MSTAAPTSIIPTPPIIPKVPQRQPQNSLTLTEVIKTLETIARTYPNDVDSALYQLNQFSLPLSFNLFSIDPSTLLSSVTLEPVPPSKFPMMMGAIQECCEYIFDKHYPYQDDSCELFIILAQTIARYGDWDRYKDIIKYTIFAHRCGPTPLQLQRITKLENIAYGYKIKLSTERLLFSIPSTWFGLQTFLLTANFFFPMSYTQHEENIFNRQQLGIVYDEQTGKPLYRDISDYIYNPHYTDPSMATFEGITGDRWVDHAIRMDAQIEARELPPHWM